MHWSFTALFSLLQRETVKEDFTCQLTGHLGNRERGVRAKRVYQMAEVVEGQLTSGPEGPKDRTAPGTTYLGVGKLKGQVALVQKQGMHWLCVSLRNTAHMGHVLGM